MHELKFFSLKFSAGFELSSSNKFVRPNSEKSNGNSEGNITENDDDQSDVVNNRGNEDKILNDDDTRKSKWV